MQLSYLIQHYVIKFVSYLRQVGGFLRVLPQALEFRTAFPHLVPPAIMVWILIWKYIFEPFIHILQHFAGIRVPVGVPGENHLPAQVTDKLYHIMLYQVRQFLC
jgi:hypothetical protein